MEFVQAMAEGDQPSLSSGHQQTVAQVSRVARGILRSKEDAEEVVCDVYAYAWRHAGAYDESRGSVGTWLNVIARSRAIDRHRQHRDDVSLADMSGMRLGTVKSHLRRALAMLQERLAGDE